MGFELSQDNIKTTKIKVPEDDLGFRIKLIREQKGLTQEALSILTKYPEIDPEGRGLSRPSIVGYEQGKNLPDARGIRLLATALEVTPSWLVLGEYDVPPEPDPRKALMDALDKYTARREIELDRENSITGTGDDTKELVRRIKKRRELNPSGLGKKLEGIDALERIELEKKASDEALARNQELHRQRTMK